MESGTRTVSWNLKALGMRDPREVSNRKAGLPLQRRAKAELWDLTAYEGSPGRESRGYWTEPTLKSPL